MVVQHILCSRMGKREVKPEPPAPEVKLEISVSDKTDENKTEEEKDSEAKDEKEKTKKDSDVENETDDKNKTDDKPEDEVKIEEKEKSEKGDDDNDEEKENVKEEKEEDKDSEVNEEETAKVESTVATTDGKPKMIEVEEYFVKYRNFSYLHCEWRTEEELYKGDKRIQAKLKRFKQKMQQNTNIFENVIILKLIIYLIKIIF